MIEISTAVPNRSHFKPLLAAALVISSIAGMPVSRGDDAQALHAIALCSDARGTESNGPGQEWITQDGNHVTVQFLPDRVTGYSGSSISYERITRRDALLLGFKPETGMSVYMLQGDEGLPSEFVMLPERMGEISSRRFHGTYGSLTETGEHDSAKVTLMNCELR